MAGDVKTKTPTSRALNVNAVNSAKLRPPRCTTGQVNVATCRKSGRRTQVSRHLLFNSVSCILSSTVLYSRGDAYESKNFGQIFALGIDLYRDMGALIFLPVDNLQCIEHHGTSTHLWDIARHSWRHFVRWQSTQVPIFTHFSA